MGWAWLCTSCTLCTLFLYFRGQRMNNKVSQEELALVSQLRSRGIPLDEEVLEAMQAACRGLSIYQTGAVHENRIYDLVSGGMALMVSMAIYNDSLPNVWIREFRPEIPWFEPQFRWLPYPLGKVPREYTYSLPDPWPAGFEPDVVLNHRVGRRGKLCPGDCIEGLLLGVGQEPIPSNYRHRQALEMRVWVIDEKGNRFGADITFLVDREAQLARERKLLKRHERSWAQSRSRLVSAGFGVPGGHPTT